MIFGFPIVDLVWIKLGRLGSKVNLGQVGSCRVGSMVESMVWSGRVDGRQWSGRPRSKAGRRGSAVFFGWVGSG